MSRVCPVSGKGPMSGNNRSHSVRATRRVWNVNLQKYKLNINGKEVEVRMSARAYRALNKNASKKEVAKVAAPVAEKPAEKVEAKPAEKPAEAK
jgi:large subunit ribosomal protein L28